MGDVFIGKEVAAATASTQIISCVSSGYTIVQMLQVGNVDGSNDATFSLSVNRNGGGATTIMKDINVEAGKAVVVYSDANGKLYLNDNGTEDTLSITASAAGDLVAEISYIERT